MQRDLDALGQDLEKVTNGFVDFLLLDVRGKPLVVLEAKSEGKNPLSTQVQARKYARSQNARFAILSNGNIHYLRDLEQGNPCASWAYGCEIIAEKVDLPRVAGSRPRTKTPG